MNMVALHGFGGGGALLNFKVIACSSVSALPSNARENTIAVITTGFTDYVLSPVQPDNGVAGMIWVKLGTQSLHRFDALKNVALHVCPILCKQAQTGAYSAIVWKDVVSYIYKGGQWWALNRMDLYTPGDECSAITGGWIAKMVPYSGDAGIVQALTRGSSYIESHLGTGTDANIGMMMGCENAIDLTEYSKLVFKGSFTKNNSNSNAWFGCWSSWAGTYQQNVGVVKKYTASATVDVELDVSGLTGLHYVGVGHRACSVRVTNCYLTV